MADIAVYISTSLDPQLNLALEETLFRNMQPESRILLFYRNNSSVIIGRNQNPWLECSLRLMKENKVPFFRRLSGGGTVYHDPGNINYSYMTTRKEFNRSTATGLIAEGLQNLGIQAEISPRNDILVHGKKISGSAYRISGDKAYHHGTLLVDADLEKLKLYLSPGRSVSGAKGTKSVSSSVTNLSSINAAIFCNAAISYEKIYNALTSVFTGGPVRTSEYINEEDACRIQGFSEIFDSLTDFDWKLGKTPAFTLTAQCPTTQTESGNIPVSLDIVKGKIQAVNILEKNNTDITEQAEQLGKLLSGTFFLMKYISEKLRYTEREESADQRDFIQSLMTGLAKIIP